MNLKKGFFIVLYGINNLGKTTQAKMLVERLKLEGYKAVYKKYPAYETKPSGELLNQYLRKGNTFQLDVATFQTLQVINRMQEQPVIEKLLEDGVIVISEDYTSTGVAWGAGAGVDISYLKEVNAHLLKEDLAFFFKGKRFLSSVEKNHKHENDDDLMEKVADAHQQLANEYDWYTINANESIENIHDVLYTQVCKYIINQR